MGTRKKVAVFSPNIYEPMTHSIQEGISKAAVELGIKVIYFASFSDNFSNSTITTTREISSPSNFRTSMISTVSSASI